MATTVVVLLAVVAAASAYLAFYAAAPGRQSRPPMAPRLLRAGGSVLALVALGLAGQAHGIAVGVVLVVTAMMTAGSFVALVGPWLLPAAPRGDDGAAAERGGRRGPAGGAR
ncbi:MAG: hypothetical protein MUE41_05390 [Gemmatimonadaceae bacterium]|nr:hypothetical protein [Gemmatimonadaceae bacterium]